MNKKLIFIIFLIVILILSFEYFYQNKVIKNSPYLVINNKKILIQISDTPSKQAQGLSYQKTLGEDNGMLFIFPDKKIRTFWMKNMSFSLDIIWIKDDKIIKINENLAPEGNQPKNIYISDEPVNYVLEVNAGFCEKDKIKTGELVQYFLNP